MRNHVIAIALTFAAIGCSQPALGALSIFATAQYAQAGSWFGVPIGLNGGLVDVDNVVNSSASAVSFQGNLPGTGVRSAARSSGTDIAANAQVSEPGFSGLPYGATGESEYRLVVRNLGNDAVAAAFEFFIPPSYLEVEATVEFPATAVQASVGAAICDHPCQFRALDERYFHFSAEVAGTWSDLDSVMPAITVAGMAGLDFSGLLNPAIQRTDDGFRRRLVIDFPGFSGLIDLGVIPVGALIDLDYLMTAQASGTGSIFEAIAAINDPFTLHEEPVTPGAPLVVPGAAAVPVPGALWLSVTALPVFLRSRLPSRPTDA